MSGIGKDYTKGKKFQLRSGNKPSGFKMMGSSPLNIVPVVNPSDENVYDNTKTDEELNKEENVSKTDSDAIKENIVEPPKVKKAKTLVNKIGNTLVGAFTTGLSRVYGGDGVIAGNELKFHDPKKDKKDKRKFGTTALDDDKTEKA